MNLDTLRRHLREAPLIASVQASEGAAVDDPVTLSKLAQTSVDQGVKVLRLQGVENIRTIRRDTGAPVIGLIKRRYDGSDVYITPTANEVDALLELGCEVIALDGTAMARPGGASLAGLIERIREGGALAMADCDTLESAAAAIASGAAIVGTTLAGYTPASRTSPAGEPDLPLLREIARLKDHHAFLLVAEGRYGEPWQVRAARQAGADAVVIGGALNDPIKQTRLFLGAAVRPEEPVAAIDIGGTWLRAGLVAVDGSVAHVDRVFLPPTKEERIAWINDWLMEHRVRLVGIGTGGTVRPSDGAVTEAKAIIPDHVGTTFRRDVKAERVVALNDGLATAWGHAMHPRFAGMKVATLALGTGVGFGLVDRGQLLMSRSGDYPRLNDAPTSQGRTFEDLLGGASLTPDPTPEQIEDAMAAAEEAVVRIRTLYWPDAIVVAGGVGLAPWIDWDRLRAAAPGVLLEPTPYGSEAGLVGASMLARFPPF